MRTLTDRFWEKVKKTDSHEFGCWEWTGYINKQGYGTFFGKRGTPPLRAHRVAWSLSHEGEEVGKRVVRHSCDNKKCVRPDHLLIGSIRDNQIDAVLRGQNKQCLPPEMIRQILEAEGSSASVAKRFGVSEKTAWKLQYAGSIIKRAGFVPPEAYAERLAKAEATIAKARELIGCGELDGLLESADFLLRKSDSLLTERDSALAALATAEREREEAGRSLDDHRASVGRLKIELSSLRTQLAARDKEKGEGDTARLDWLEKGLNDDTHAWPAWTREGWMIIKMCGLGTNKAGPIAEFYPNLRTAIDAARKETP